mmetsp:Transcript_604/g.1937  ORF Transcript_604/g.1937 Transcript_604/m.1937 type:complete len:353 (+) Transcript_604:250-1308(+)
MASLKAMLNLAFKHVNRFEIVCHIMLIASVMVVLARFNKYKSCQDPMAAWLVVDYGLVVCFRTLQICYTVISYPTSLPSLRTRRALRVACIAFQALFLYPFLCTWTVLGSVWYLRSGGCLPEDGQHLGFPVWLLLCYLGVCGMAFVFLRQLGSFTTLYREQEALAGNPGAAPFSAVLEEFGRLCLADRAVSWDETIDDFAHGDGWPTGAGQGARACALSPEDISTLVTFKVSSVQGGDETCMICLDDVRRGGTGPGGGGGVCSAKGRARYGRQARQGGKAGRQDIQEGDECLPSHSACLRRRLLRADSLFDCLRRCLFTSRSSIPLTPAAAAAATAAYSGGGTLAAAACLRQ